MENQFRNKENKKQNMSVILHDKSLQKEELIHYNLLIEPYETNYRRVTQ